VEGMNVLFSEQKGSVEMFIIRGNGEEIENRFRAAGPVVFDRLPMTLEEIFIYETGGDRDEFREILF
jgi:ABC-2 type transport system ATP-binding protein